MSASQREEARSRGAGKLAMAIVGVAILAWSPADAWANTSCSGSNNFLGADNTGNVYVDVGYGVWEVCNLGQSFTANGLTVTTDSCKARGMRHSLRRRRRGQLQHSTFTARLHMPRTTTGLRRLRISCSRNSVNLAYAQGSTISVFTDGTCTSRGRNATDLVVGPRPW